MSNSRRSFISKAAIVAAMTPFASLSTFGQGYEQAIDKTPKRSAFHTDPMFKEIVKFDGEWVKDSFITLSEKPGIGVEINEDAMKKYATPGVPFFE